MSEHPVTKHARRTYRIFRKGNTSFGKKIGEVFIEIMIIVFAVSLTLYLERWREDHHDRKLERQFLIGLREDMEADKKELKSDSTSYHTNLVAFEYFLINQKYDRDSLNKYSWTLQNTTNLDPNASRFEALKSSGKLYIIHDETLLRSIVNYYQEVLPTLIDYGTRPLSEFKRNKITAYFDENYRRDAKGAVIYEDVLRQNSMQNYLRKCKAIIENEILLKYHNTIVACDELIAIIDEHLD